MSKIGKQMTWRTFGFDMVIGTDVTVLQAALLAYVSTMSNDAIVQLDTINGVSKLMI
jgi:hypothetical protein